MGVALIRSPPFEGGEGRLATVPRDNGTNAFALVISAPREAPWFWGLDFFEWQGGDGPQYGNAANREAAMKAFRAAWDHRPKTSGKS
jgi:hypothetical protein